MHACIETAWWVGSAALLSAYQCAPTHLLGRAASLLPFCSEVLAGLPAEVSFVKGRLVDRVGEGGRVVPIAAPDGAAPGASLFAQFPLTCHVVKNLYKGWDSKVAAFRVRRGRRGGGGAFGSNARAIATLCHIFTALPLPCAELPAVWARQPLHRAPRQSQALLWALPPRRQVPPRAQHQPGRGLLPAHALRKVPGPLQVSLGRRREERLASRFLAPRCCLRGGAGKKGCPSPLMRE